MDIQKRIPAALCAIHNFISIHDPTEKVLYADDDNEDAPVGDDHIAPAVAAVQVDGPSVRRDRIAQDMWEDYLAVCQERGIHDEDEEDHDEDEEDRDEDEEDGSGDDVQ
jgi:hypothetical protein